MWVPDAGTNPSRSPRRTDDDRPGPPRRRGREPAQQVHRRAVGPVGVLDDDRQRPGRHRVEQLDDDVGHPVGAVLRVDPVGLRRARARRPARRRRAAAPSAAAPGHARPAPRAGPRPSPRGCRGRCRAARAAGRAARGRRSTPRRARPAARVARWRRAASSASWASRVLADAGRALDREHPALAGQGPLQGGSAPGPAPRRGRGTAAGWRRPTRGCRAPHRPRRRARARPCPSSRTGRAVSPRSSVREWSSTAGCACTVPGGAVAMIRAAVFVVSPIAE